MCGCTDILNKNHNMLPLKHKFVFRYSLGKIVCTFQDFLQDDNLVKSMFLYNVILRICSKPNQLRFRGHMDGRNGEKVKA